MSKSSHFMKLANENAIVMVDDNPIDRRLIKRALDRSSLGNDFVAYERSEAFFDYLDELEQGAAAFPALVLLDINMPPHNGFEILSSVRNRSALKHLNVVMLTHSDNPKDIEKAHELGAGYSEKFSGRDEAIAFLESLR